MRGNPAYASNDVSALVGSILFVVQLRGGGDSADTCWDTVQTRAIVLHARCLFDRKSGAFEKLRVDSFINESSSK